MCYKHCPEHCFLLLYIILELVHYYREFLIFVFFLVATNLGSFFENTDPLVSLRYFDFAVSVWGPAWNQYTQKAP